MITANRTTVPAPPAGRSSHGVSRLFRPEALVEVDVAALPAARAEG